MVPGKVGICWRAMLAQSRVLETKWDEQAVHLGGQSGKFDTMEYLVGWYCLVQISRILLDS